MVWLVSWSNAKDADSWRLVVSRKANALAFRAEQGALVGPELRDAITDLVVRAHERRVLLNQESQLCAGKE